MSQVAEAIAFGASFVAVAFVGVLIGRELVGFRWMARALWAGVCAVRLLVAGWLVAEGNLAALAYAVSEFTALAFAAWNQFRRGTLADESLRGYWAPIAYMFAFLAVPIDGEAPLLVTVSSWICCGLNFVVTCTLGVCYSVGVPTFVRVCDRGAYRLVRHPLALINIAGRLAFIAGNLSAVNVGLGVVFMALKVASVWAEEGFLERFDAFREYRSRVKWRLLPGVW